MNKLVEDALGEFSRLPGIGKRSALRMVLFLLKKKPEEVEKFGSTLIKLRNEIRFCRDCHNISEQDLCEICSDGQRDKTIL